MDSLNHTATNDSREHYITDILDALPLGVLVFDRELKVQRLNSRAAQLLCIGDDVVKTLVAGTGEQADTEGNWLHELSTIFSDGGIRTYDGINYCANGQQMILRFTCSLAGGEADPQHALAVLVVEEISERVKLQKALSDSERMATIGKLTSKIAHELNNPMDGILRYINLTVRIVEEAGLEKPKKYLLQCRHGIMRMVQIVSELLEFSRRTYPSLEYIEPEQLIEDALKSIETKIDDASVVVNRNFSDSTPHVRNGNLFQVFSNIIKNAVDAMSEGGTLSITTEYDDEHIKISFRDTGPGLPQNPEAIFEPFFSTKQKGQGIGLGLAICKDIISRYNGTIEAVNAAEGGSVFTVCLPINEI